MRHSPFIAAAVAGLVAVLPLAADAQSGFGPQPGTMHAKRVEVMDNSGFDRPLPAFSMLIPAHWQTEGGVVWTPNAPCAGLGFRIRFHAHSPDRTYGVGVMPQSQWSQNSMGYPDRSGCPQAEITSARQLIEAQLAALPVPARVVDFRERPDLRKGMAAIEQNQSSYGMTYRTRVEAGEALVAWQENGVEMRGSVAVVATLWEVSMEGSWGMPGYRATGGSSLPGYFAYAPAGALDLTVTEAIRKSIRPAPDWSRRIAQHAAVIARQNRDGARRRHQITMQTNAEINQMISEGWAEREAIRDRGQRESIEAIRGVETYHDPYHGGTVELDHSYEHAWQLDDGTYVLTDDNFFEPFRELGRSGQRLTPVP